MIKSEARETYRRHCAGVRNALDDAVLWGSTQVEFEQQIRRQAEEKPISDKMRAAVLAYARAIDGCLMPF